MRNLSQFISTASCVHLRASRISAMSSWYHILAIQTYTQTNSNRCIQTYTDIDVYREMYGGRQRGRERSSSEILLHLKSVQNLVLNFFIHFPKSPEHQSSHPKCQALYKRSNSPFLNSWYFKHIWKAGNKLQEEQGKEDEVNSKIDYRPAMHTACPGVGLH